MSTPKTTRATKVPGETAAAGFNPDALADDTPSQEDPAPSVSGAPAAGELPNAIDIDAKAIRGPVLTKQGWVCPDESGRRPADALKV